MAAAQTSNLLRSGLASIILIAALIAAAPVFAAAPRICGHAIVALPSAEAHRTWLERTQRYGPEEAAAFAERMKRVGPGILNTQIVVQESMGVSAWVDTEGYSGLREAKYVKTFLKLTCEADRYYPVAVLIGLKAVSISHDALVVAKSPRTYQVISISGHPEGKPFAVRLGRNSDLICKDIRACEDIAAHPLLR
jgi:hypothetical protein